MRKKVKRFMAKGLLCVCALGLFGCGKQITERSEASSEEVENTTENASETNAEEFNGDLNDLRKPVDDMVAGLEEKYDKLKEKMGGSYDGYISNKEDVNDFYEEILTESDKAFSQLVAESKEYFRKAFTDYASDEDALNQAIDDYYDAVYSGILDDYYDRVYGGVLDEMYDDIYGGIIDDAYDSLEYEVWSSESSDAYESWSDTSTEVYKSWSNISSICYSMWSEASSQWFADNKDVNDVMKKIENAIADKEAEEDNSEANDGENETEEEKTEEKADNKESQSDSSSDLVDGMRPEFKEALDSYEEFFNEYVEFMKKYMNSTDTVGMLKDYTEYMSKYADMMQKLEKLGDEEMNTAEAAYYLEVTTRINKKLLEVAQ